MNRIVSAVLLYATAALLAFDGVMHSVLWGWKGVGAIRYATTLLLANNEKLKVPWTAPFGEELKVLWLADSANLVTVATICLVGAAMPRHTPPIVLALVAVIPGALAVLLYIYGAPMYVANMMAAAAVMILAAALLRALGARHSD